MTPSLPLPHSARRAADFDALARAYRTLEWIAYGDALEQARFCHLAHWREARDILLLGDGDGRCLERVLAQAPAARVLSIDASAAMLAAARDRLGPAERERVEFRQADLRTEDLGTERFDGIATMFVLDCFDDAELADLVPRVRRALRPGGRLLYADFEMPAAGEGRVWARVLLPTMYLFFRLGTGLATRRLPRSAHWLERAGFTPAATRAWHGGFLRSSVWTA